MPSLLLCLARTAECSGRGLLRRRLSGWSVASNSLGGLRPPVAWSWGSRGLLQPLTCRQVSDKQSTAAIQGTVLLAFLTWGPSGHGSGGCQRDVTCWYMNNDHRVFIILKTLPEPFAGLLRSACSLSLSVPKAGLCCGGFCQPLYYKNNFSTAFETGEAVASCECYFILSG